MANFIFNEGAIAALSADIDWVNTPFSMAIYETPFVPTEIMSWADVSAAIIASKVLDNPVITSYGAASSDNVSFTSVTPTEGELLQGIIFVRDSDSLLLCHLDTGFEGINPVNNAGAGFADVLNMAAAVIEYTFSVRPGDNNERAWFRL